MTIWQRRARAPVSSTGGYNCRTEDLQSSSSRCSIDCAHSCNLSALTGVGDVAAAAAAAGAGDDGDDDGDLGDLVCDDVTASGDESEWRRRRNVKRCLTSRLHQHQRHRQ